MGVRKNNSARSDLGASKMFPAPFTAGQFRRLELLRWWGGVEWSGEEWSGVGWSGVGWSGVGWPPPSPVAKRRGRFVEINAKRGKGILVRI